MENIPFDPLAPAYTPVPRHGFVSNPIQYRLEIQRFNNCPPEFKVRQIDFTRDIEAYERAALAGQTRVSRRRGPRVAPLVRDEESIERSQWRAKTQIRKVVCELAPNHFTTFTTRESGPDYLNPGDWREMWARFIRLVSAAGIDFQFVAVLERHPSNPQHLHLHVAWRGHANYNILRKLWHISVARQQGIDIRSMQRGAHSPGNIQDKPVKAPRGSFKQVRKIAKYISKYITKDLIAEFNKKRYWVSRGVSVVAAQLFWLDSLSAAEAIREGCRMVGQWDDEWGICPQDYFRPSDRVFWCAVDPEKTPPPPF